MTPASSFPNSPSQAGIPAGRQGDPKEYAMVILNLASNGYMNGSTVVVDGGWLLEQS